MSKESRKLEDSIHLSAAPKRGRPTKPKRVTLIFFITGNPGLIEYYRTFFHCLRDNLRQDADEQNHVFEICGSSLVGFELSEHDHVARITQGLEHTPPYSLSEVVDAVEISLSGMTSIIEQLTPGKEVDVILMGHSVGAYIALEVLQRHRRRLGAGARESRISGVVCLFPTVVDIGKSERGRVLSALSRIPYFPLLISLLAKLLTLLLPTILLNTITSAVTNRTAGPVTTAFLTSPHGVRQALHMGRDEMSQITSDKWDDEVWGAAHPSASGSERAKLFFLFGKEDHWVAEGTREELMRVRGSGRENWMPRMEVEETGSVPHGFCIAHSEIVAEKAVQYVREICGIR